VHWTCFDLQTAVLMILSQATELPKRRTKIDYNLSRSRFCPQSIGPIHVHETAGGLFD